MDQNGQPGRWDNDCFPRSMIGILLVDKPEGWTSHDVVAKARRSLQTKKIGHAGTLDPIATGLLVLAVGPATRYLQYLSLEPKIYEADFKFGESTDTFDRESEANQVRPVPPDLLDRIERALPGFTGEISQLPPMYSAVKKDGKALYHYARAGQEIEREPRSVTISSFSIIETKNEPVVRFRIVCSGGTYVRTLAHDLGEAVGCGAHVTDLRRTGTGEFQVDQASLVENIPIARLIPLREALKPLPVVEINEWQARQVREGRDLPMPAGFNAALCGLVGPEGDIISIAKANGPCLHPECVIPEAAPGRL